MIISLFVYKSFKEVNLTNLIEPDVTIGHQVNINLIVWQVWGNFNLDLEIYFSLHWNFLQSQKVVVFITHNNPPSHILYFLVFLDYQSIGYLEVLFLQVYVKYCLTSLFNSFVIFYILLWIEILGLYVNFHDW